MKSKNTEVVGFDHVAADRVIGAMLKEIRLDANITCMMAARLVSRSIVQIKQYESGSSPVSLGLMVQFAIAYDFDVISLITKSILRLQDIDVFISDGNGSNSHALTEFTSLFEECSRSPPIADGTERGRHS